jgi:GntR family transcriptional regulator, carbon starvation induced regulator
MVIDSGAQPSLVADGAPARSRVEAAVDAIRRDILDGTLAPGTKLRFEMLYGRYGVGASTLREALTRLVGETLVTSEEQRGFRVAAISLADLTDLTATRKLIGIEALRQSIRLGDDVWEAGIVAAFHRLIRLEEKLADGADRDLHDEYEARNRDLHLALIAACPSRWLKHMHAILLRQSERYLRVSFAGSRRDVHQEHKAIVDAALARDAELAARLADAHIGRLLEAVGPVLAAN